MILKKLSPFLGYLRKYRLRIAAALVLMVLTSVTEGAGVGLLYPLLKYIQAGNAEFSRSPAYSRVLSVLHSIGVEPSIQSLLGLIFLVIAVALCFRSALWMCSAAVFNPVGKDVRDKAFEEILHSHLFYFYSGSSGALINTLESEAFDLVESIRLLGLGLTHVISVLIYITLLLYVAWKLTFIVAALAVLRFAVSGLSLKRVYAIGQEYGAIVSAFKSYLVGIHQGIDVVKAFGMEDRELRGFRERSERIRSNTMRFAAVNAQNSFLDGLLGDGLLCLLVYVSVAILQVPMPALLAFLFVASRIIPKITDINHERIEIGERLSRLDQLPKLLSGPGLPRIRWGNAPKKTFDSEVVFDSVAFSYPGAGLPSLQGIGFKLRKNTMLALVGESGSGKSTLARLLLRFFDPTEGSITIDGVPISDVRREDWTRLVVVVSQETFVFDDTIENNIKYGAESCSEAEFREAVRLANAEEFIRSLPEREKTRIGERGIKVSGGQRQRIAIARAFLRNPPILILDEATSAMDAVTEKLIQDALNSLARDRTMLVIAHRFTTIRHADEILVLSRGRIAERGSHRELMDLGGLYKGFHDLQAR